MLYGAEAVAHGVSLAYRMCINVDRCSTPASFIYFHKADALVSHSRTLCCFPPALQTIATALPDRILLETPRRHSMPTRIFSGTGSASPTVTAGCAVRMSRINRFLISTIQVSPLPDRKQRESRRCDVKDVGDG
jgi:hypothetical protein